MEAKLYTFNIVDFQEVYVVLDDEKKRLHLSSVTYSFSLTFDLTTDLDIQLADQTRWGNSIVNENIRKVAKHIIHDLKLIESQIRI